MGLLAALLVPTCAVIAAAVAAAQLKVDGSKLQDSAMLPALDQIVSCVREREARLRSYGIMHIHIFGSIMRGMAGPRSDIDLLVELGP